MMIKKSHLISAVGAVAGASFALSTFAAGDNTNPFQADDLDTGHLAGQAGFGDHEGNCGEGEGEGEGKCGEGEGNCGEGEGNCGEGSCGGDDEGDDEGEGNCGTA